MPTHKTTKPFLVRKIPLEVHIRLKIMAASKRISMEQLIVDLLTKAVMEGQ